MGSSMAPGPGRLYRRLAVDVAALGWPASPPAPPVTEADLAALPDAVTRYLNFMGVARPAGLLVPGAFHRAVPAAATAAVDALRGMAVQQRSCGRAPVPHADHRSGSAADDRP